MNKKPRLAVVTHTRRLRPDLMALMMESLLPAMPDYAEHFIIDCPHFEDYELMKWEALQLGEFVCFVDDDDLIINDSINKCMAVFDQNPDLGVVFTSQQFIAEDGTPIITSFPNEPDQVFSYQQLALSAQAVHHLVIMRSDAVGPLCLKVSQAFGGIGIEWLMKSTAALIHKAVHVPIYGYQWRQYATSISKDPKWIELYNKNIATIQSYLLSFNYPPGDVPQAVID